MVSEWAAKVSVHCAALQLSMLSMLFPRSPCNEKRAEPFPHAPPQLSIKNGMPIVIFNSLIEFMVRYPFQDRGGVCDLQKRVCCLGGITGGRLQRSYCFWSSLLARIANEVDII